MGIVEASRPGLAGASGVPMSPRADLADAVARWYARVADASPILALPTDYPRGVAGGMDRASRSVVLPNAVLAGVAELAVRDGIEPAAVVLAAFLAVAHRYARESDILAAVSIGVRAPVAGSPEDSSESVSILRLDVAGDLTFHELARRVHDETVRAAAEVGVPVACTADLREGLVQRGRPAIAHVGFTWCDEGGDGAAIGAWASGGGVGRGAVSI